MKARPLRGLVGVLAGATLLLFTGTGSAHIALKSPIARSNDQVQLKVGPCGQTRAARTDKVTVFEPGETITVAWDETIDHPGHFRISFDPDGASFPDPTSFSDYDSGVTDLVDHIADKHGTTPIPYTQDVTLPDVECDNCTLQLIQVMTDKPPYGDGNDVYYQCADLVLRRSDAEGTPTDDAGTDAAAGGSSGGCALGTVGGASTGGAVLLAGVLFGLALRRRRHGSGGV